LISEFAYRTLLGSIPIHQYEADANPVHPVVVIQKALAISNKVLNIAADPLEKGEAPFSL
jgi:hypothetical protein